jgi:ATP synthase protein I
VRKRFDFKKDAKWVDNVALVTQVGLTIAGSILFCLLIGYYLDKWIGTKPLFTVVFILLGIAGGGYTAYRQIMEVAEQDENRQSSKRGRK